jgi:2-amino-4-hydroxy-6-hydroxymethyldihydropteridine diphosphokinase
LSVAAAEPETHIAFIGLGSNIEPETNLPRAVEELRQQLQILCTSSAWEAPALGTNGPDFLNAVVKIETTHSVDQLKSRILRTIESKLGRVRTANKNAPRTIDLDILIFDEVILDAHIWVYAHLAVPLAECDPERRDPSSKRMLSDISIHLQKEANIRNTGLKLT